MKLHFVRIFFVVATLIFVWSCADYPSASMLQTQSAETLTTNTLPPINIDLKRLPIGDGKISTYPKVGSVWSCRTRFRNRGGAHASGDWIQADGTYDLTAKPTVDGAVSWSSQFKVTPQNNMRVVAGNRLPKDPTGQFPISSKDDAYAYDRNPNSITAETYQVKLPAMPQTAAKASCLPLGVIGVLVNGGYFFSALDARGEDAVAHEIQDSCQGHPERDGAYHYHSVTTCMEDRGKAHSTLVGYAFDGFGIYGHRGEDGEMLTNAELDACHGHTHEIEWNGKREKLYHYHATWEYPYTVGCYRGIPVRASKN